MMKCGGISVHDPGSHPAATVLLAEATAAITGPCSHGGTGTLTVPLAPGPFSDPLNSSAWYPLGPLGQDDPATYEGSVTASVCSGSGTLNASAGAVFSAEVEASQTAAPIHVRFHYRDPNAKGQGNVNCQTASNPPASVCGASWSGTQSVKPNRKTKSGERPRPAVRCGSGRRSSEGDLLVLAAGAGALVTGRRWRSKLKGLARR
jgi:hypothetical protein